MFAIGVVLIFLSMFLALFSFFPNLHGHPGSKIEDALTFITKPGFSISMFCAGILLLIIFG